MQPPIFHIEQQQDALRAWSTRRLPFQGSGWKADFRSSLQTHLRQLPPRPDSLFHAVLTTNALENADAENVLLYNLGASCYAHLTQHGLIFQLRPVPPPPSPVALERPARFLHEYSQIPRTQRPLANHNVVAEWSFELARLTTDTKPHTIWAALKQGQIVTHQAHPKLVGKTFAIETTLHAPQKTTLAAALKPLLDAIVSAFHVHDGTDLHEITTRLLANGCPVDAATCRRWLMDESNALLGRRNLVHPFGKRGVQWNPADDLCHAADIRRQPTDRQTIRVTGRLLEFSP